MGIDIDTLLKALDNEDNEGLLDIDLNKIKQTKNDILQKVGFDRETLKKYNKALKNYKYIDEIPDIKFGSYVRWIPLKNPSKIKLTNGGIVCELSDQELVLLSAMNYLNK